MLDVPFLSRALILQHPEEMRATAELDREKEILLRDEDLRLFGGEQVKDTADS